ncbi:hypothetical protein HS041_04115 [Planomonospora sp. ID67723]|uniref:DUF6049 family protein n=1 Tax=Planomonospora sp. ID67723 TaxID=2738134 RepID=UPI0018C42519|nr:DUF6049 family protein [Planomonospora sp. ID67723]MBG0826955.1 hypothetical protein [Planomonospora sp. ID67723]
MIRKAALLAVLTATLLSPAALALPGTANAGTGTAGAPAANRQNPQLVVEAMGPDVSRAPDTEIRISGSLVNPGTVPLTGLRIRRHHSAQPFTQRAHLAAYLSGQEGFQPTNWRDEKYVSQQAIPAGGKAPWEFVFTPQTLGISRFGVYPVTIEVRDALGQQVAVQRTLVTYLPREVKAPRTRLSVLLPIVDQPRRADDGTFVDERLPASLAAGERLGDLLKVAQDTSSVKGLTWVVDPALLDDARAMGAAHWVKSGGEAERRPGDAAASGWLDSLRTALADLPVVAVPYADPDVAALAHNGLDDITGTGVEAAGRVTRETLGRDVRTDVGWPVGGAIDHDGLDLLATAGIGTVLLNAASLPPVPDAAAVPGAVTPPATAPAVTPDAVATVHTVNGPVRALVADPVLSDVLAATTAAPGAALLNRQRFIAETAMISSEPAAARRTVLAVPPRRWSPDPAYVTELVKTAASLPWVAPVTLGSVKAAKTPFPRSGLTYTVQDRDKELGKPYMGSVRRVGSRADLTAAVTVASDFDVFDLALLRLSSSAWRGREGDAVKYAERVRETIDSRIAKVWITGNDPSQIRTLAGTDGEVPISVRNELESDEGVAVRVKVTSKDPGLLKIEPYKDEMVISGGQTQTIRIPMTSEASGQTTVTVQLTTSDGRKYGQRVKLTVRTTGYTAITLVIVGAALVVMLAAVVMRVLRRRGARRTAAAARSRQTAVPAGSES